MQLDPKTLEVAVFGAQVEQFLDSDIGQYLVQKAEESANEALEALATVDPEQPALIRAIQNRVAVADLFLTWLREAVIMGDVAQQKLREDA